MQGDQSKTLTETSTLHRNHRAADGINVTTGTPSARANIGDRKSVLLQCVLEKDPQAADVKWSLFVAACQSYRYDSCLKPFPPQFIINGAKDIDSLREVVDKTPALSLLAQHLNDPDVYQANPQVIDLLYWVLVHLKDVRMKSVPKLEFDTIMEYVHCETAAPAPNLIFQLVSDPQGTNEVRWQQVSKGYKTLYAFHGSRLDNFHSILHYGLQKHLNKVCPSTLRCYVTRNDTTSATLKVTMRFAETEHIVATYRKNAPHRISSQQADGPENSPRYNSLFGHGIYLSSELSVSLPYSPMGYSWGRSIVGSEMSCVALCEVVNHPDVKCQDKESDRSRSIAKDSIGGEVPNKYYVALNSDLVKVRYLLIYSKCSQRAGSETSSSWLGWLGRHKLLTFILGYIVVLASVGLSNNDMVQRYYHLMLKRDRFAVIVHGLSVTGSTLRIDIIAFKESTRSGFIIDPTVRFETIEEQPAEVDKEKNNIYNPTIPYYLQKYQLKELEVIGLLVGARGTATLFMKDVFKRLGIPTSIIPIVTLAALKGSIALLKNHLYSKSN
ncbi:hypothetical protein ANN_22995 [Periplaneta americana]|uniref:PARP catalytic domain-containing protein n=1 Tax=Periplaneta americana TaxID=6978 RepID=A0ABQ8SK89_PERAM|nr:hypothetical protein ANN_22995 [Periplaneta americana]